MSKTYTKVTSPYGFVSASPLPSEDELASHYSSKYYENPRTVTYQTGYTEEEIEHKKLKASLVIFSLEKIVSGSLKDKKVFEVGYGEGFILNAAIQAGAKISGVDFTDAGIQRMNPQLQEFVSAENAYTYLDKINSAEEKFDVCIIQNVLEHVIDPDHLLKLLRNSLSENGLLVVNVPNDYSDLQKMAIERGFIKSEFWFGPVEHLHYFNTHNLPHYISALGFKIEDMFGDFPIDIFLYNEHSNYISDREKGKAAHRARVTLDLLMSKNGLESYHRFCQSLSGVGIGRNVCVIARKI